MKAFVLKEWEQLKPSEQNRIIEVCNKAVSDEVNKQLDEEDVKAQTIWIRLAIINLAQCGVDKDKILEFMGSWRSVYRKNSRCRDSEEQQQWIDGKITEIFGETQMVTDYIETLTRI